MTDLLTPNLPTADNEGDIDWATMPSVLTLSTP